VIGKNIYSNETLLKNVGIHVNWNNDDDVVAVVIDCDDDGCGCE